jgi:FAR-17a/AIG1-like protein
MSGSYPYPLFAALDTTGRILLFTGAASMMTGSTIMLRWLYGKVNGLSTMAKKNIPGNVKGE